MGAIEVAGLVKTFDDLVAVDGVDLDVDRGEILGLVGINGAGKTTLLRMLAGILEPDEGSITLDGEVMGPDATEARRRLAFVPDTPTLFETLTIYEHLLFVSELYQVEDREPAITKVLGEFALEDKRDVTAASLSRGMRQKLMICCAFVHEPPVLLLDEPLTGLDPLGRRHMRERIAARAEAGTAVIISSHQLEVVEQLAHRFVIIHNGRERLSGTLAQIQDQQETLEEVFLRVTADGDASPQGPTLPRGTTHP
jgi:ABC-2 type transport system ATP-binding protein